MFAPKSTTKSSIGVEPIRPVDNYFNKYSIIYPGLKTRLILSLTVPFSVLGLLGLVWCIPFPNLKFLGQYNGYFNWASFLVAFSIFYYYKLSPVLSYLMLLVLFAFSYLITDLQNLQKAGGPMLWVISLILFVIGLTGELAATKVEGKQVSVVAALQFMLVGPIWLLHFLAKKIRLKY